jgi:Uncharacterized protein conserved in bacteria
MDILLLVLGILCILAGITGCIIPALPGPPLSYIGILLLEFTRYADYSLTLLIVLAILVVVITVVDNVIPIYMTKKLGGTKWGVWGATIGLLVGIFGGIVGVVIGPFIGALVFELAAGTKTQHAFKSASGALVGFFFGIGGKLIVSGIITYYFFSALFHYFF